MRSRLFHVVLKTPSQRLLDAMHEQFAAALRSKTDFLIVTDDSVCVNIYEHDGNGVPFVKVKASEADSEPKTSPA
jgi:hypothetical protein